MKTTHAVIKKVFKDVLFLVILLILLLMVAGYTEGYTGFSRHNNILIRGWLNATNETAKFVSIDVSGNANVSNVTATNGTFDNLLVKNYPICTVNYGMIASNLTVAICSQNITPWWLIGSNLVYTGGNVGIGTTTPDGKLHLYIGDSNATVHTLADDFILEDDGDVGLSFLSKAGNNQQSIIFGDNDDNAIGYIQYDHNDDKMHLVSDNTVSMTLDGGNVGIGTDSPNAKLEIDNGLSSTILVTGDVNANIVLQDEDGGVNTKVGQMAISADVMRFRALEDDRSTISVDNMLVMNLSNGNVGIGTASPRAKLEISGATTMMGDENFDNSDPQDNPVPTLIMDNRFDDSGAPSVNKWVMFDSNPGGEWVGGMGMSDSDMDFFVGSPGNFKFHSQTTKANGTGATEIISISNVNGKRPNILFNKITGSVAVPNGTEEENAGDKITFWDTAGYKAAIGISNFALWFQSSGAGGGGAAAIRFFTSEDDNAPLERLTIKADGNVGIGTTTPLFKLDVAGDTRIGGDLYLGGDIFQINATQLNVNESITLSDKTGTVNIVLNASGDSWFNGGNVGIGNTIPNATLHVSGDIIADEGIYLNNKTISGVYCINFSNGDTMCGNSSIDVSINGSKYFSISTDGIRMFDDNGTLIAIFNDEERNNTARFEGSMMNNDNINDTSRFVERNLNNGSFASSALTVRNDIPYSASFGLTSSQFSFDKIGANVAGISSVAPGNMVFMNRYNYPFIWYINKENDTSIENLSEVMRLDENGLNVTGNGSVNYLDFKTKVAKYHQNGFIDTPDTNWHNMTWNITVDTETTSGFTLVGTDTIQTDFDGIIEFDFCLHPKNNGAGGTEMGVFTRLIVDDVETRCSQGFDTQTRKSGYGSDLRVSGTVNVTVGSIIRLEYKVDDADLDFEGNSGFDRPVAATIELSKFSDLE